MPSLTPIVLNRRPTRPAACTPSLTSAASLSRCMLQVLPSHHMLQMPTCGFWRSAGVRPVPYSIACDAPWLRGWVIRELYLFAATYVPAPYCHLPPATCSLDGHRRRDIDRIQKRHHRAQLRANDFHGMLCFLRAQPLEVRQAGLVLLHPVIRELP